MAPCKHGVFLASSWHRHFQVNSGVMDGIAHKNIKHIDDREKEKDTCAKRAWHL